MKKHEVTEVLAVLSSVWPEKEITRELQQAYLWVLSDEPADLVQEAARRWMRTGKFFPKPAELIALARDVEEQQMHDGIRSLPMPQHTQLAVNDAKRLIGKLLKMDYRRAHPNLIAAAYGRPPEQHDHTSEPIPGGLIAEITRGAA